MCCIFRKRDWNFFDHLQELNDYVEQLHEEFDDLHVQFDALSKENKVSVYEGCNDTPATQDDMYRDSWWCDTIRCGT